ncbi:MAG: hypothetical protein FVQ82_08625 [Planctomycetes bacterium]|nr:hypothetical protein [Planctomycetota bacterium]
MSQATVNDRCMLFVGGNDYKSNSPTGQALAGGCTKAWWDSQPNIDTDAGKQTAMGKLMGSDGEPIISVSTTVHSLYDISGTNYVKVTDSVGTAFYNAEVGMLAYHEDQTSMIAGGAGIYKIREVGTGGPGETYIVLDTTWFYEGYPAGPDGSDVFVGGAWNGITTLCESYVDAEKYTHEVWVNKSLAPTDQWDWSDWSGDVYNNTWLKVIGFHRIPGDITDPGGAFFQSNKSMKADGVHADKLIAVDMSGLTGDLIAGDNSYNITMRGFYFNNAPVENGMFELSVGPWGNIDLEHNAFEISVRMDTAKCRNLLLSDSFITTSSVYADVIINTDATSVVTFLNNYIKHDNSAVGINVAVGAVFVGFGNVTDFEGAAAGVLSNTGSTVVSLNNTYTGFDAASSQGQFRVNNSGSLISINDIILNKITSAYALEVAKYGGSFITKNLCAYSEAGQLIEVMELHPDEATGNIRKHDIDNLLEVDPLLDGDYEPLEEQIRTGGMPDILGDATAIGAIKTMNTTVINTAVQAALTTQGYTTGRAPKLDNLDDAISNVISALGSLDSIKLGADGLDDLVISEPSGDPDTWSVPQKLMWLVMRFLNKHTSDNFNGIVVHKSDGTVSTSQPVTEVDGLKQVGKAQ